MNKVNHTLYIPLYAKAFVSRKKMLLSDPKAEEIWEAEGFSLKRQSKWLAYWLGMRAVVFDRWTQKQLLDDHDCVVIHIGCGMDSRCERVSEGRKLWLDVDFPAVIQERKKYYLNSDTYRMIGADVRKMDWLTEVPIGCKAIIVMEGVSMYMANGELLSMLTALRNHCGELAVMMDCYSEFAASASRYRNPINELGVSQVYGMDDPLLIEKAGLKFIKEHLITPRDLIGQLKKAERSVFRVLYGGRIAKKMYRLYEYMASSEFY